MDEMMTGRGDRAFLAVLGAVCWFPRMPLCCPIPLSPLMEETVVVLAREHFECVLRSRWEFQMPPAGVGLLLFIYLFILS